MRIVLTGGGTGGHITPILALAHELKRIRPDAHITYVGERNGKFAHITKDNPDIDEIRTVFAGKFRRYHGESWFARVLDVKTLILNLRDLFYFAIGTLQSLVLIRGLKPDVMFLKGGFVGVPTGLAAAFWHIPFVTHDSDAIPGLANRLVSRWAVYNATALSASHYSYPDSKVKQVGVLVSSDHYRVTEAQQKEFKNQLGLEEKTVILVTGASSGAITINKAVKNIMPQLLKDFPDLFVIHQVGKGKTDVYQGYTHERLEVKEYLKPFYVYTGASDLVVTRGSATNLAELGVQGRACIVIPSPWLAGGHQLKNAEKLEEQGAAVIVKETTINQRPEELSEAIRQLLRDQSKRQKLGEKLNSITIPDAAEKLAVLLLEAASRK